MFYHGILWVLNQNPLDKNVKWLWNLLWDVIPREATWNSFPFLGDLCDITEVAMHRLSMRYSTNILTFIVQRVDKPSAKTLSDPTSETSVLASHLIPRDYRRLPRDHPQPHSALSELYRIKKPMHPSMVSTWQSLAYRCSGLILKPDSKRQDRRMKFRTGVKIM